MTGGTCSPHSSHHPSVQGVCAFACVLNQFVFEVDPKANKIQIKESVEKAFKVEVVKVRTMNVEGKKKRLGRHQGRKSNWKKALITLKEGQTIEYFEGA